MLAGDSHGATAGPRTLTGYVDQEEFVEFGGQRSSPWDMNSYGSTCQKGMPFQPASAYCEECHGAGAHLVGAAARGSVPSNCERCQQRFVWNEQQAQQIPLRPFGSYFKNRSTCHDPHLITANDWRNPYTVPGLNKQCDDCDKVQAAFFRNRDTHEKSTCTSCHGP